MKLSRHASTVAVVGAAVLLAGTAGVAAGSGAVGGPWLLGEPNHAGQTTKLVSDADLDKATVKIKNKGQGPALSLVTSKGRAPFRVNSQVLVKGLNADRLDGLDSSQLVRSDEAIDADTLDGKNANAFVQVPPTPLSAFVLNTEPKSVPESHWTTLGSFFEVFDPSGMHSQQANPHLMTAPRTGTYMVSATVTWAADSTGYRTVALTDPVGRFIGRVSGPPITTGQETVQSVTGIVHLNQGQRRP